MLRHTIFLSYLPLHLHQITFTLKASDCVPVETDSIQHKIFSILSAVYRHDKRTCNYNSSFRQCGWINESLHCNIAVIERVLKLMKIISTEKLLFPVCQSQSCRLSASPCHTTVVNVNTRVSRYFANGQLTSKILLSAREDGFLPTLLVSKVYFY